MRLGTCLRTLLVIAGCAAGGACLPTPDDGHGRDGGHGAHDAYADTSDATAPDANANDTAEDVTPAPPGERCDAPVALTASGLFPRIDNTRNGGDPTVQACRPSAARQRFFDFTVPPGQRAVFAAIPLAPQVRLVARMVITCDAAECIDDGESPVPGAPVVVSYANDNDDARHKVVAVSASRPEDDTGFAVRLHFEPIAVAPPTNDNVACERALPLAPGATIFDQYVETSPVEAAACPAPTAPQRFYVVHIPAHMRARVNVRSVLETELIWRPLVRVLDGCETARCLSMDRSPTTETSFTPVLAENRTDSVRSVIVAVASPGAETQPPNPFDIDVSIEAFPTPAPNAICGTAQVVPVGAERVEIAGDTNGGTETGSTCGAPPSSWKVVYYAIDVAPAKTLTVTLRGNYDRVRLRAHCDATVCIATAETTENSGPRTVTYTNTGGATQRLILEVGSSRAPTGGFNLVATVTP